MSRILRFIAWAALFAAIVPAAACRGRQMYEGPRRPKAEVAQLGVASDVLALDGQPFPWHSRIFQSLELLPGAHSVTFQIRWDNYWKEQISIDFSVEGGRKYWVQAWEDTRISDTREFAETLASISPVGLAFVSPILVGDRLLSKPTGPPAQPAVWVEDLTDGRIVGGRPPPTWRPPDR